MSTLGVRSDIFFCFPRQIFRCLIHISPNFYYENVHVMNDYYNTTMSTIYYMFLNE